MKTKQTLMKLLSALVVLTMLFSMFSVFASAADPAAKVKTAISGHQSLANRKDRDFGFKSDVFKAMNSYRYQADQEVTAILSLKGSPAIEAGKLDSAAAKLRRNQLKSAHESVLAALDAKGIAYKLLYDYTSVVNGLALTMKYGDLEAASSVAGVETVFIANEYKVPEDTVTSLTADAMTGADVLTSAGFGGHGVLVAVLDTGTNTTHEAFADYGLTDGLTEEQVNALVAEGLVSPGKYVSAKIPFAYDYANQDDDVTDPSIGHGTHVAGIAVGYAEDEEGNVIFSGAAPEAQLIAMKVFTDNSGSTNTAIYIKALEDAYTMGVDVVNMSLGSPAGFTYDPTLENELVNNIYKRLDDAGIVACISAGNEYSQAYGTYNYYAQYLAENYGYDDSVLPTYYTDYGLIGSPAAYAGNMSVASAENNSYFGYGIVVDGTAFYASDSSDDKLFIQAFGGQDLPYVIIGGFGEPSDYEGVDVTGKLAVVTRGNLSFQEKLINAADAGAIGMVCVNNQSGLINMSIEEYPVPAASLPQAAADAFAADADENGCGTLHVNDTESVVITGMGGSMSAFSNWGIASSMAFGPMITGVGGFVYSAYIDGDQSYEMMSGTSMAAPNVTGNMASLLSLIKDSYPDMDAKERADLAEALVESTATVLDDGECFYSPRKQGAGLVNSLAAAATESFILNPLHSLGDSEEGVFTFTLSVANMADYDKFFVATPLMMTDTLIGAVKGVSYMALASDWLVEDEDYFFTSDAEDGIICVPAGSTADVTFTIELDAYLMALLDYYFPFGTYVDGYVFLDEVNSEYPDEIHASFFGFFGDWTAAPALELVDSYDVAAASYFLNTAIGDAEGHTYRELGYGVLDVIDNMCVGYNEALLLCDNPALPYYGQELTYLGDNLFEYMPVNPAHAAISTPESSDYFCGSVSMTPALLRNVEHLIMLVVDAETGEVYYIDDTPYLRKNVYDEDEGMFSASSYFLWDGVDYSVEEPYYLSNDTVVSIEYYALIDYADDGSYQSFDAFETWEEYYEQVKAMCGESQWTLEVTVDCEAPELTAFVMDEESEMLLIGFVDNGYIAAVMVYDNDSELIYRKGFSAEEAGEVDVIGLPISELEPGFYYVDVIDYATNAVEYVLMITEDGEAHIFDPETGYCKDCGLWTDGLFFGEFEYDSEYNVLDMYVSSAYDVVEVLEEEGFEFDVAELAEAAAKMHAGMEFVIGDVLMIDFDENATAQLAAQENVIFSVSLKITENTVKLELSVNGADFSDGVCEVYYLSPVDFNDEDVRVYYVNEETGSELIPFDTFSLFGLVFFETSHFSHFEILFLDEYGKMLEQYVDQALIYAQSAAQMADDAAAAADEAAAAAKDAADEADRAAAEADAAEASADAAEGYADSARARAEAAAEQAKQAAAKASAAAESAKAAKAQADAAAASASAAAASAAAAAAGATSAADAAAEAKQYAESAQSAMTAAGASAAAAASSAADAQSAAAAAKASADAAAASASKAEAARKAAETAKKDAEKAKAEAEAAKAAAESAKAEAEKAQAEAEKAKADAAAEKAAAEAAKLAAEAAKTASEAAQSAAEKAEAEASAEKAAAEAAKADAEAAKTAAESAKAEAEAAKAAAESAKAEAEAAMASAEAAKTAAESQRAAAEAAQSGAAADKAAAEAAKTAAESAKKAADSAKAAAEKAKADADAKAAAAETAKAAAESAKAAADAAKKAAEEAQADAVAKAANADAAAEAAQTAKKAAEDAAEKAKTAADAEVAAAEAAKKAAEEAKTAAEAEKAAAEKAKADAEAAQKAAEAAKEAAESVLAEINEAKESGCGAVVGGSIVMILTALAAAVALKKKH